jgi:uncharacterized protein (DUF924 family)
MTGYDEHQGPATKGLPEAILEYWFGTEPFDDPTYRRRGALWFNGSAAVDVEITERFSEPLELAAAGRYDDWSATPTGTLAWTILVDQFPRHIFRGTPRAFATTSSGGSGAGVPSRPGSSASWASSSARSSTSRCSTPNPSRTSAAA